MKLRQAEEIIRLNYKDKGLRPEMHEAILTICEALSNGYRLMKVPDWIDLERRDQ